MLATMRKPRHDFTAEQYAPRANDYVASAVHSMGEDLEQIEAELGALRPARVLDLGCGGGHVSYRAAPYAGEVVACDVTPSMLAAVAATAAERGLANIRVEHAAAESLPFPDASFDAVLSRYSAHHWQNLDAGLREARRVLKPAGRALFIDTLGAADVVVDCYLQAIEVLRDASHARNYTIAEWAGAFARAGFVLEGITLRKLPIDFADWVARARTPAVHVAAIRSLQESAPPIVRQHLGVAADGSFAHDAATFVLRA